MIPPQVSRSASNGLAEDRDDSVYAEIIWTSSSSAAESDDYYQLSTASTLKPAAGSEASLGPSSRPPVPILRPSFATDEKLPKPIPRPRWNRKVTFEIDATQSSADATQSSAADSAAVSDSFGSNKISTVFSSPPLKITGLISPTHRTIPSFYSLVSSESSAEKLKIDASKGIDTHRSCCCCSPSSSDDLRETPTSSLDSSCSCTNSSAYNSSPDLWDVHAAKAPIRDHHILNDNAKIPAAKSAAVAAVASNPFDALPDTAVIHILFFLSSNHLVLCSRLSRRFYFLSWSPELWQSIVLSGESQQVDVDLALDTIIRSLSSINPSMTSVNTIDLGGCLRLTDRGLHVIANGCPLLKRLEIQYCRNVTNYGLMELVNKCSDLDHLDATGCHMITGINVHQPPSTSELKTTTHLQRGHMIQLPTSYLAFKRQLNLQFLDLSDCFAIVDSGLKMIAQSCPQVLYLFLRRCVNVTDVGISHIVTYCPSLRELSISDCAEITDFGLFELSKLGQNLRYLSVAKCYRISDVGVKQLARHCYKLRYLNARGCEAVSDDALATLATACSRLRSIDIGKCDVTDLGLRILSEQCTNLRKLSVKGCEMVSDKGIQWVAYKCRGLQRLNMQDCPVTVKSYKTVRRFCRRCIIEHNHAGFN